MGDRKAPTPPPSETGDHQIKPEPPPAPPRRGTFTFEQISPHAESLVRVISAVEAMSYCVCSQSRTEHTFWNDKIYDVHGLRCPGPTGGEFHYDPLKTAQKLREAQVAAVRAYIEGIFT